LYTLEVFLAAAALVSWQLLPRDTQFVHGRKSEHLLFFDLHPAQAMAARTRKAMRRAFKIAFDDTPKQGDVVSRFWCIWYSIPCGDLFYRVSSEAP
jgi:hypothetical protein